MEIWHFWWPQCYLNYLEMDLIVLISCFFSSLWSNCSSVRPGFFCKRSLTYKLACFSYLVFHCWKFSLRFFVLLWEFESAQILVFGHTFVSNISLLSLSLPSHYFIGFLRNFVLIPTLCSLCKIQKYSIRKTQYMPSFGHISSQTTSHSHYTGLIKKIHYKASRLYYWD